MALWLHTWVPAASLGDGAVRKFMREMLCGQPQGLEKDSTKRRCWGAGKYRRGGKGVKTKGEKRGERNVKDYWKGQADHGGKTQHIKKSPPLPIPALQVSFQPVTCQESF
jgi:hypothetical protein